MNKNFVGILVINEHKMLTKLLISLLIIESVVVTGLRVTDFEEYYDDRDMTESPKPLKAPSTVPALGTPSPPITTSEITTKICTESKPKFISTRKGYQTLDCSAKICDSEGNLKLGTGLRFAEPIFDWNSPFGHIYATNGTCDSERLHCWHSIDVDLEYLSHQMSCSVSDYLSGSDDDDDIQWMVGSDFSIVKRFKGLSFVTTFCF